MPAMSLPTQPSASIKAHIPYATTLLRENGIDVDWSGVKRRITTVALLALASFAMMVFHPPLGIFIHGAVEILGLVTGFEVLTAMRKARKAIVDHFVKRETPSEEVMEKVRGNFYLTERVVCEGGDLNKRTESGAMLFDPVAIKAPYFKYIVKHGFDVLSDEENESAFKALVGDRKVELVNFLLSGKYVKPEDFESIADRRALRTLVGDHERMQNLFRRHEFQGF